VYPIEDYGVTITCPAQSHLGSVSLPHIGECTLHMHVLAVTCTMHNRMLWEHYEALTERYETVMENIDFCTSLIDF